MPGIITCNCGTAHWADRRCPKCDPLKCVGVSRDVENEKALALCFNRIPDDNEIRIIHDNLKNLGGRSWPI